MRRHRSSTLSQLALRLWSLILVLALVAAACGDDDSGSETTDGSATVPATTFDVIYRNGGDVIEPGDPNQYLPRALGWYEDLGLNVTVGVSDGSSQAVQLLISGDADFVQIVPAPLISARAQGADVVAVCTVITSMNARIGVLPDSDITSFADLRGRTIGVASPTSSGVPFARAAAASAGLDPDIDIDIVPAGFGPASLQALQSGSVDALAYWTGYFADLEAATGVVLRQLQLEETKRAPGPVIAVLGETIEQRPEMVARFLQAVAMSQEYAFENPEAAIRHFWELYPEDKATGVSEDQAMAESVFPLNVQIPDMAVEGRDDSRWCWNDPAGWTQLMDFLVSSGALDLTEDELFPIEEAYTNEFIDEANDFDDAAVRELAASG